jgi:hypothetical protein
VRWIGGATFGLVIVAGTWVLGLHLYYAHRLDRARARFTRELKSQPPANHPCNWPKTDPHNGAYWYLAAAARVPAATPGFAGLVPIVRRSPATWSPPEVAQVSRVLEALRQPLELAYGGTLRPVCEFPEMFPDPKPLVWLSRLLIADVGFNLQQGRPERALRSTEALRGLALGLESQPVFVSQLVGVHLEARYLLALRWMVESKAVPTEILARLRAELPRDSAQATLARFLRSEEAQLLATFSDPKVVGSRLYDFWGGDNDRAIVVEGFGDLLVWSRLPYRQALRACAARGERHTNPGEIVWTMLAPNYLDFIGKCQAAAASRQLAGWALELRLDGALHGHLPERLPPAYAGAVDPFAGAHPSYTPLADGSARLYNSAAATEYHELASYDTARILPFAWTLPSSDGHRGS